MVFSHAFCHFHLVSSAYCPSGTEPCSHFYLLWGAYCPRGTEPCILSFLPSFRRLLSKWHWTMRSVIFISFQGPTVQVALSHTFGHFYLISDAYILPKWRWTMHSVIFISFQVPTVQMAQSMPTSSPARLAPTITWHSPMTCTTVCPVLVGLHLQLHCLVPRLHWYLICRMTLVRDKWTPL